MAAEKNMKTAAILAILLGGWGVDAFYLGDKKTGLISLLVSLLSCGTLWWAMAIWGIVRGVKILKANK